MLLPYVILGNMPLIDELVLAKKTDPPTYTQDKNKKCDWSIIFQKSPGYDFTFPKDEQLSPVEQFKHLRKTLGASESFLDETQLKAVENFLENRVSLIQVSQKFDVRAATVTCNYGKFSVEDSLKL